jgi:hypothetical protein
MIRVSAVLLLVACTAQADLTFPISGTSTTMPPATTTPPMPTTDSWRWDYTPRLPTTTTTTTSTTTTAPPATTTSTSPPIPPVLHQLLQKPRVPQFTLGQLVDYFFTEADRPWALKVALCESSGLSDHVSSDAVHPSSRASGWFQHLPKFWQERSEAAGFAGESILDPVANVGVAAWLFYDGGGKSHWYPSERCWK